MMILFHKVQKKRLIESYEEPETQEPESIEAIRSDKTHSLMDYPGEEDLCLGSMLQETGFAYDPEQDVFYSIQDPWQKPYGYCRFYDIVSPFMRLIFDSEPIQFTYEGKHWLIEFWKGQYGITTGCEIGIYMADEDPEADREFWLERNWSEMAVWQILRALGSTLYRAVDPEDQLEMSMTLLKNDEVLFTRQDRHWWLTGFVLGEFSEPEELVAQFRVTLKTPAMRQAFTEALEQKGYEVSVLNEKTVELIFDVPYSSQPITRQGLVRMLAQRKNKKYCEMFKSFTQETQMRDLLTEYC